MATVVNLPTSAFVDDKGYITRAWQLWLLNPQFQQITISGVVAPASGGTGNGTTPGSGQIAVGNGSAYIPTTFIPASALPSLSGDVTTPGGSLVTTLATVNGTPGAYGNGSTVPTLTINAKGLVTASSSTSITGASVMTVVGAFGCNGKAAQTSSAVSAAVAGTAGAAYTAVEQGIINNLVTLVNQLRTALVNNGIAV